MLPIVQAFGTVVTATKTALQLPVLHYEHGHPLEIVNTLISMTKTQAQGALKYPLVALFQDFPETEGANRIKSVRVQVIIATLGVKNGKAAQRYTTNFIQTLEPIYQELIYQIRHSPYFLSPKIPTHTKTDRPYWGREGLYGNVANTATDELDCIQITNMELQLGRARLCDTTPIPFKNF